MGTRIRCKSQPKNFLFYLLSEQTEGSENTCPKRTLFSVEISLL